MKWTRSMAASLALAMPALAVAAAPIIVHRDPGCGCCEKWAAQVKARFGRQVQLVDAGNRDALHRKAGLPGDLVSCHTAVIDGLVFEGHVPIEDMKRLLAQRPKGVSGLAVGGMPIGSPGMEMAGMKADSYPVVAFGPAGRRVFARH